MDSISRSSPACSWFSLEGCWDAGGAFPAALIQLFAGQHADPAGPAGGDDPGRAGGFGGPGLATSWTAGGLCRLAFCGLHHPDGGMVRRLARGPAGIWPDHAGRCDIVLSGVAAVDCSGRTHGESEECFKAGGADSSAGGADGSGLAGVLERYPPAQVLWSGPPAGTRTASELLEQIGKSGIPYQLAQAGQVLDLGDGARLKVMGVAVRVAERGSR